MEIHFDSGTDGSGKTHDSVKLVFLQKEQQRARKTDRRPFSVASPIATHVLVRMLMATDWSSTALENVELVRTAITPML